MNEEEIKKAAEEAIKALAEKSAQEVAKKSIEDGKFISKEDAAKETKEAITKSLADQKAEFNAEMAKLSSEIKKMSQTSVEGEVIVKSFNEYLAESLAENAEAIKSFKKGSPELAITLKAVGDMSIANNFPNSTPFIQDVRTGLIPNVYDRVWIADILPQGTSSGNSVLYPKENGGEGGVALWSGTGDKAKVDFDLTSQAAFFKWLAGYVIVDREMLDDIPWLTSYLQNKLLISLKIAENNFVLNGATGTNPVQGLLDAATAYNGTFTNQVDRIIDAGYGQIVEDTKQFYRPTNTILNPRDAVAIGLNKADGSGEYDLPNGSVAFSNGRLEIGGLINVDSTDMEKGKFLTFDRNAIMFLRRLSPEIRMFEDAELAKQNKIMFRIEERVTQAIFNDDALVTGDLTPVPPVGG